MKNPITLIFISILLMVFTCACETDDNENIENNENNENNIKPLPPNTEIGANTFIFRVNGGEIIESEVGYLPINPRIGLIYNHVDTILHNDYRFAISGRKQLLGIKKSVSIIIKTMPKAGKYVLAKENNYADYGNYDAESFYYWTDNDNTGMLNITKLDTSNHIISGNFKFDAKRHYNGEELEEFVTVDGQFDVKYIPNEGVNYY